MISCKWSISSTKKNWIQFSFHQLIFVLQSLYLFFKTVLKYSILDRQYWHMSNLRTSNNRDFFLPKKPASCIPFSQKIWKKLFFISWNYSCMSTHVKIRRQGCVNTNLTTGNPFCMTCIWSFSEIKSSAMRDITTPWRFMLNEHDVLNLCVHWSMKQTTSEIFIYMQKHEITWS